MSRASFHISHGAGPRRTFALGVSLLVIAGALFALNEGLKVKWIDLPDITVIESKDLPKTDEPEPLPKPDDPTFDSKEVFVPVPEISVEGQESSGAPMSTTDALDTVAGIRNPALPLYPKNSIDNCEQGVVGLTLRVGADGRVIESSIASSSGYPALDDAALKAAQRWRFTPATYAGRPVESTVTRTVRFDLKNEVGVSMTERELRECLAGN